MQVIKCLIAMVLAVGSSQAQDHKKIEKLNISELKAKASVVPGSVMLPDGRLKEAPSYHYERKQHNGTVVQISGNAVTGYQQIEIPPLPQLFKRVKAYYPNGNLKAKGQQFKKNFIEKGTWTYYDAQGNLKETIDKDKPYVRYPWEQVLQFLKQRNISYHQVQGITRSEKPTGAFWNVSYIKEEQTGMGEVIVIEVNTGKISSITKQNFTKELD